MRIARYRMQSAALALLLITGGALAGSLHVAGHPVAVGPDPDYYLTDYSFPVLGGAPNGSGVVSDPGGPITGPLPAPGTPVPAETPPLVGAPTPPDLLPSPLEAPTPGPQATPDPGTTELNGANGPNSGPDAADRTIGAAEPDVLAGSTTTPLAAPVFEHDFPDPMVIQVGGVYYAYGTQTSWETKPRAFPILVSTDRKQWGYAGDAFPRPPEWVKRHLWGPSVLAVRGPSGRIRFILYYSGLSRKLNVHCIGVALAWSPLGPFQDQGPLACGDAAGWGYIDPAPLIYHSHAYLYLSVDDPHHSISVLPLAPDLVHLAGPRHELFGVTQAWELNSRVGTVEAPNPIVIGDQVTVLYSGNSWAGRYYATGQATAPGPLGPFTKDSANPILSGTATGLIGPGSPAVLVSADGRAFLTYHGWVGEGRAFYVTALSNQGGTVVPNWRG